MTVPAAPHALPNLGSVLNMALASASGGRRPEHRVHATGDISGGRVRLGPGTLYGALTNLLNQKLIRRSGETVAGSDRRKVYALTPLGEKVLILEGERLASLSRLASDVTKRLGGMQ